MRGAKKVVGGVWHNFTRKPGEALGNAGPDTGSWSPASVSAAARRPLSRAFLRRAASESGSSEMGLLGFDQRYAPPFALKLLSPWLQLGVRARCAGRAPRLRGALVIGRGARLCSPKRASRGLGCHLGRAPRGKEDRQDRAARGK